MNTTLDKHKKLVWHLLYWSYFIFSTFIFSPGLRMDAQSSDHVVQNHNVCTSCSVHRFPMCVCVSFRCAHKHTEQVSDSVRLSVYAGALPCMGCRFVLTPGPCSFSVPFPTGPLRRATVPVGQPLDGHLQHRACGRVAGSRPRAATPVPAPRGALHLPAAPAGGSDGPRRVVPRWFGKPCLPGVSDLPSF